MNKKRKRSKGTIPKRKAKKKPIQFERTPESFPSLLTTNGGKNFWIGY